MAALVIIGSLIFVPSLLIGSGTGWVTLFGADFGYSIRSGNMVVSKAAGGFYQWWAVFADHEFIPRKFGVGYDSHAYGDIHAQVLPQLLTFFEGNVHALILPIWILLVGFSITIFLIGRRPQKNAEQVAVADRHQHHCCTPTTPQSPGG